MTVIRASEVQPPALVYLRGLKGVESQIWWQPAGDIDGYFKSRILAWHKLDGEEAGLPFASLKKIYPPPAMPDAGE